jgi:hypothetical protein
MRKVTEEERVAIREALQTKRRTFEGEFLPYRKEVLALLEIQS